MTRLLRRWWLLAIVSCGVAHAAPTPPLATLPTPAGELRIEPSGALMVGTSSIAQLGRSPTAARLRAVTVAGKHYVDASAWTGKRGEVALVAVDGAPSVLLTEGVGPNEDGDLVRSLEITPRGVRRWQATPAVARCDAKVPLFLESYDLDARAWRREPLPRASAPDLAPVAAATLPAPRRALRFSSASTDGQSARADLLGAPRELDDGDDTTIASLGSGADASGAFVTARAPREVELTNLRIVAPPLPARLPAALVVIGGTPAKPVHRLRLDGIAAGTARWFAVELRGACVSFVVDEAPSADPIAIAELDLYAADDKPGGLELLAAQVATDGPDADGAAHSLDAAGLAGARAALGAITTATASGRQRLVATIRANAKDLGEPELHAVGKLLETAHGDERAIMVDVLITQPAIARAEATRILADATQAGQAHADALVILARLDPTSLFDRLGTDDRVATRAALVAAAPRNPTIVTEAVRRLPLGPRGDLLAVIEVAPPAGSAATIVALGAVDKLPFDDAVRVLSILGKVGGPALLSTATDVVRNAADPTLRLLAVTALKDGPGARLLLVSATSDVDARVRERALERLSQARDVPSSVLVARSDDAWPQIRRVAYAGFPTRCEPDARALLDHRVFGKGADADPRARAEALAALARCGAPLERIAQAFDKSQPSDVTERAAQVLAELGGPSTIRLVGKALDRHYTRNDGHPEVAVALLRALGRLGARARVATGTPFDDDTLRLLRDSAADPFFPGIRIAALEALSTGCPDGAKVVFDRADADPEPAVVRASALGRGRCGR